MKIPLDHGVTELKAFDKTFPNVLNNPQLTCSSSLKAGSMAFPSSSAAGTSRPGSDLLPNLK